MKKDKTKLGLIAYLLGMIFFVILKILASFNVLSFMGDYAGNVVNVSIQLFALGLIPVCVLLFGNRKKEDIKQTINDYGYKSISIKTVLLSILLGVLCYIGMVLISLIFSGLLHTVGWRSPYAPDDTKMDVWTFLFTIFSTCILPGLFEEFMNRGVLLVSLRKFGVKKAIIFSAVCFGLMHFNITQFHYCIVMGLVFGYLVVSAKSIWPAVIAHFTANFSATLYGFLRDNKYIGYQVYDGFFNFMFSGNPFVVGLKVVTALFIVYLAVVFIVAKIFSIEKQRRLIKKLNTIPNAEVPKAEEYIKMAEEVKAEYSLKQMIASKSPTNYILETHLEDAEKQKEDFKKDIFSKTILYSVIVLAGLLTIFTFIWGFL